MKPNPFFAHKERKLRPLRRLADQILALEPDFQAMTDRELAAMTGIFRERLSSGETLDDLLPEAFAAAREAAFRALHMKPYPVQLIGGIVLHQGRIAQMRTGEGKTLTEILPAYLNALSGRGVHIITVNDYLAKRDRQWMSKVYDFLGLTTGLIYAGMEPDERRKAYDADITYGVHSEFGFDYLRDNMVTHRSQTVQRGHVFAIVDEIDSILIDEARTPLILSGQGEQSTLEYIQADRFARYLRPLIVRELDPEEELEPEEDYIVEEKTKVVMLTAAGIRKAERYFRITNISDPANAELYHRINQALKAYGVMKRDVNYVVKDDEIFLVDEYTGRIMYGRRFNEGLHQAIEAKEGITIRQESRTLATVTYQNYFRMYEKLSGMTGTAKTSEQEFQEIYHLDVVEIPTNRPVVRQDHPDWVFFSDEARNNAVVRQITACYRKGQPVLVGTTSIEKSERLSERLQAEAIPHQVLNARYHEEEAQIIAQVGRPFAVTIATNMAGRGTDIILGGNPGTAKAAARVKELGGLFIIGTERHEARRVDDQLRGRAGRQGDPGESRFFLSLEDDLLRLYSDDRVAALRQKADPEDPAPIERRWLKNAVEHAAKQVEGIHFQMREQLLKYDDVVNEQRNLIYAQRRRVLAEEDMGEPIARILEEWVRDTVDTLCPGNDPALWFLQRLEQSFTGLFLEKGDLNKLLPPPYPKEVLMDTLLRRARESYAERAAEYAPLIRRLERMVLLQAIDKNWTEHIDALDQLRRGIHLRAYAQKDPAIEYRIEAYHMLDETTAAIRRDTMEGLFRMRLVKLEDKDTK